LLNAIAILQPSGTPSPIQSELDVATWIEGVGVGFSFRNFEIYRIRTLLYAGRPIWQVLGSIVIR
jgi:hypothetical protein